MENRNKSYTSIEQSKVLSEILSPESADMFYCYGMNIETKEWSLDETPTIEDDYYKKDIGDIPCWSLSALLSVFPKIGADEPMLQKIYYASDPTERYICEYSLTNITSEYDNPVDACYEMILKLDELKML